MNQRSLIAIIILAGIGSIGSVLAYSGSISAGQGNFNNILVTGTCAGCSGEGDFTSYSVILNQTVAGSSCCSSTNLYVSTNGTVFGQDDNGDQFIVYSSGTVKSLWTTTAGTINHFKTIDQSITGKYKVGADSSASQIRIFKNDNLLQTRGIKLSDWFGSNLATVSTAISSDGKYIALSGDDSGNTIQRLVIFRGS